MKPGIKNQRFMGYVGMGLMLGAAMVLLLTAQGCGGDGGQTGTMATAPAATTVKTTPTTSTAVTTQTTTDESVANQTSPPPPPPSPTPAAVQIISIEIDKNPAKVGEMITFTAKVKGDAKKVSVVYGAAGGDVSTAHSISSMLAQGTSGGITTWKTTVAAPKGFPSGDPNTGTCFYTAIAVSQDDTEVRSEGNLTFTVKN